MEDLILIDHESPHCAAVFLNFAEHPMLSDLKVPHYHLNLNDMTIVDLHRTATALRYNQVCLTTFLDLHHEDDPMTVEAVMTKAMIIVRSSHPENRRIVAVNAHLAAPPLVPDPKEQIQQEPVFVLEVKQIMRVVNLCLHTYF